MDIAICDDCFNDIQRLEELILQHRKEQETICFTHFFRGEDLLACDHRFDIIFLDINMEGEIDGMETGQRIRDRKDNALLSFYTAYDYPASHIVKTRPFSYLMKNSSGEDLYASLEMILNEARRRSPVFITVSCDVGTFTLLPSDILYIAIYERGSAIYLSEKKAQELNKVKKIHGNRNKERFLASREKLEVYYELLKGRGFVFAKKSYIINTEHIIMRLKDTVVLSDQTELTVARSRKKQFDEEIMAYWGRTRGGM
ncbi:MAG: response regulator [Hungatella sp.]|nr:response regulator [Hungatella sp.]